MESIKANNIIFVLLSLVTIGTCQAYNFTITNATNKWLDASLGGAGPDCGRYDFRLNAGESQRHEIPSKGFFGRLSHAGRTCCARRLDVHYDWTKEKRWGTSKHFVFRNDWCGDREGALTLYTDAKGNVAYRINPIRQAK